MPVTDKRFNKAFAFLGVSGLLLHAVVYCAQIPSTSALEENRTEALVKAQRAKAIETKRARERGHEQEKLATAIFEDRRKESQLTVLKQAQLAMVSNTKLMEVEAEQHSIKAEYAIQFRNAILWLSGIGLATSTFLIAVFFRVRETRRIANRERQLNSELNQKLKHHLVELRTEEEAKRKRDLARERMQRDESLCKLTGGVAHDFNNLLTVILNSNQVMLMKEETLSTAGKALLESSTTAAQDGAAIIKQLMSYAGQQSLANEPIRVSDWLQSVRGLLKQTVGESISYIERDLSEKAVIAIDNAKLTTAIINLLSNAKDAIFSNGSIELAISKFYLDGSDRNGWSEDMIGHFVLFEVIDNGVGIAPELISQVCNPFFTTKQLRSGAGLGLSSVLGFVRQSRGEFRIESQFGKGTSAKFILPLSVPGLNRIMPDVKGDKTAKNKTILVVDDQDAIRHATAFMLKMLGYTVLEANGSESAIQLLQGSVTTDIVLTDVQMPGIMDGLGLRTWIQSKYPQVRVILTSGYTDKLAEIGQDFLQKPYALKDIEELIERKDS